MSAKLRGQRGRFLWNEHFVASLDHDASVQALLHLYL